MPISEFFLSKPRWVTWLSAILLIVIVGLSDWATSWEFSLFVFYAIPILLAVWVIGRDVGLIFALASMLVWWAVNQSGNPYQTQMGFGVAALSRGVFFFTVAIAGAALKARRESDRERIEMLERSQNLEREILRTSEREQQRIGRDLHDGLGPHLAALGFAASMLADQLRKQARPEAASAEQIQKMAVDAVALSRDLARGLFPVQMEEGGLMMALNDLAQTMARVTGLDVSVRGNAAVTDPEKAMHIFRIVQEAVHNAVKHSRAEKISIDVSTSGDRLRVRVSDDGVGMDLDRSPSGGMGIHSMDYRARALGGKVEITPGAVRGLVVRCEIPNRLPPERANPL